MTGVTYLRYVFKIFDVLKAAHKSLTYVCVNVSNAFSLTHIRFELLLNIHGNKNEMTSG